VDGGRWVICSVGGALGGLYGAAKELVLDLLRHSLPEAMAEGLQVVTGVWGVDAVFDFSLLAQSARSREVALGVGKGFVEGGCYFVGGVVRSLCGSGVQVQPT
jgi:hypothetical protein